MGILPKKEGSGSTGIFKKISSIVGFYGHQKEAGIMLKKKENLGTIYNGTADTSITIAEKVLDEFRTTVGGFRPETGGMLACSKSMNHVDTWRFDQKSVNTSASYSYDVQEMSEQYREWKREGIRSVGFVHSHPASYRQPSYDDIATAYALMKFFKNDFFYLPIIIADRGGLFTMYFFVVRQVGRHLNVNLDYVQKACAKGYEIVPFRHWEEDYLVDELESYYRRVNGVEEDPKRNVDYTTEIKRIQVTGSMATKKQAAARPFKPIYTVGHPLQFSTSYGNVSVKRKQEAGSTAGKKAEKYFQRLDGFYPDKVLEKVIVCVGTGGARTVLENMARNGFHNFILIDGDKVSPSNIATQGVFISEMGMWKTEAIRARILDIHPEADVVCVNRFLDDSFTDEQFAMYLHHFTGRKATDYLVLGCCDTFDGNRRSSELSLKYGLPYIGAGMYRRGLAAEVVFTYPGVTPSCPRCMLRSRYEAYEEGYQNDVTSEGCPTFATERLNTLIGQISIMMLMYGEAPRSPYHKMLEGVKDRNFVWIRMSPYLGQSELGIGLFDRAFSAPDVSKYTFTDETLWIPQHPDSPKYGEKCCKLCGGVGDLRKLRFRWPDTRKIACG